MHPNAQLDGAHTTDHGPQITAGATVRGSGEREAIAALAAAVLRRL